MMSLKLSCLSIFCLLIATWASQHFHDEKLREKVVMASFSFPQLYKCVDDVQSDIPAEKKSQSNEDTWLWDKIFANLPEEEVMGATFIEMGALDGLTFSNTFYFEKKYDWRGLLIEGHPVNQKELRHNLMHRPNSVAITAAVCQFDGHGLPGTVNFTSKGGAVGAAVDQANTKFMDYWHKSNDVAYAFHVACVPLQSILETTGMLDVDLFSLDVEGSELYVLRTINFKIINFRVILVEADGGNPEKDEAVRNILRAEGFEDIQAKIGYMREYCRDIKRGCTTNDVFVNPNFMERKNARRAAWNMQRYYKDGTGVRCDYSPDF